MVHLIGLKCMKCQKEFKPHPETYVCDTCGDEGILDVLYDYSSVKLSVKDLKKSADFSLWRYRPLLPVPESIERPHLQVGYTPFYHLPNFEKKFKISSVFLKDDGRNPTASLKDRASSVGVMKAIEAGRKVICCASTGNAASSLAGFSAAVGLKAYIFVPKRAPKAKIAQLLIYGAKTIIVDDTYDKAFELSIAASKKFGFYNRNCAYNPYLVEGKKTVSYEMWEQMNFTAPDRVYVSIGDGCITSGIYKGFYDLEQLGLIDRIPKIVAVQAAGCNPVEVAMKTGVFTPQNGNTIADSIAVGIPRNRLKAMRALKESKGDCISVTDDEIKKALVELPRETGVFAEPAGVTAFAGFLKQAREQKIDAKEKVVILVTGNGLKDIESALSVCQIPTPIAPTMEAVEQALK